MHQFFLVVFDRQRVITPALEENLLGRLDLGVNRIGQRGLVLQRHFGQQLPRRRNLIAAFLNWEAAQPAAAAVDGADQLDMRVTQRLAIDDHQFVLRRTQHLFLPTQ